MLVWLNNFNNASFETFQTAKIINLGKSDNNGNVKGFLRQSIRPSKNHAKCQINSNFNISLQYNTTPKRITLANQQAYYDAIAASTSAGESTPFIEFMLGEVLAALTRGEADNVNNAVEFVPIKLQGKFPNNIPNIFPNKIRSQYPQVSEVAWHIASLLNNTPGASADLIGEALGISGRMVRNHIATLRKLAVIERIGSNKSGYWKVNRIDEEGDEV